MEVPAKLRTALVGIRYWLFALLLLATTTFLVACNGGETKVIVVNADIGTIILTIENDSLVAGGFTTIVTAEVFKFDGNPVPDGTVVNFVITPIGNIPDSTITQNGVATALLKSGTAAGEYTITATAGNVSQVAFGEFIPGPAAGTNTSLSANPTSIPADGTSISLITLTAKDANGNPVADGTQVNFYTTHGTISDATAATANGVARTALISAEGAGVVANVTAVVDGLSKTTKVGMGAGIGNGTGTASYIELSITEFSIRVKNAGGKENSFITARALDESGDPIADFPNNIRFSIENGPGGGEELDGSLSPVTKSTDNGTASVSLTSGTVSGTVRIRVEVILDGTGSGENAPFATALTTPIAIEAGEPSNIVIFQDNTVQNNNDGSTSRTLSALAQDLHGNPVENGTVIYFGLVDNPDLAGPPYLGYISSGTNGVTNGTTTFTSAGNRFQTDGLIDDDILIILEGRNEGGHRIKSVVSNTALTLYNTMNGAESGLDFVAGYAELGSICGSVQTGNLEMDSSCTPPTVGGPGSIRGVGHTKLTWTPQGIFKPFCLYAESVGGDVGDTLCGNYAAASPVKATVTIIPSTVLSGTTGIFVEAEFKDGSGNPVEGETVAFNSSNPLLANFGGSPTITEETNSVGKAGINNLETQECLNEQTSVTVTASIAAYSGNTSLTIQPTAPTASFTCTDSGDGSTVDCTDTSTTVTGTSITDWSWDIGCNGSEDSSDSDPTLNLGAGTTEVCLTVTNDAGCSDSNGELVTIGAGAPIAAFTYTNNLNGTATFSNTSSEAPGTVNTTFAWTFPDATVPPASSQQNPANVNFTAIGPGPHNVTLQVTNDFGVSDSVTQPVTVSAAPTASFSIDSSANNGTAILTDTSTTPGSSTITGRLWTIPLGATVVSGNLSLSPIVTINFGAITGTPGTSPLFDVTLQVTNSFTQTDSVTQPVTVTDPLPSPPTFSDADQTDGTSILTSTSNTTAGGNPVTYQWTLPAGASLTSGTLSDASITVDFSAATPNVILGDFDVELELTNNFGATTTTGPTAVTVTAAAPAASFSNTDNPGAGCGPINFTDTSVATESTITAWSWDFASASATPPTSTAQDPAGVDFSSATNNGSAGDYVVTLQVTDNFGNVNSTGATTVTLSGAACP